jgi:hypothetical protein
MRPTSRRILFPIIALLLLLAAASWLVRPASACPLGARGCGHPCCVEVEYFWKNGRPQCKCAVWDEVCLGLGQLPLLDAELTCTAWGSGGWCAGALDLDLTATDPHGGEVMLSGDLHPLSGTGGTPFACPASVGETTCLVPLPEGAGVVNYSAVAASTGLTASDSTPYQRDSLPPDILGALDGVPGQNNWYTSPVDITASASDPEPGSALAAFDYLLDGAPQAPWPASLTLTDGLHSLTLRAADNAGNPSETTLTVNVDTLTPELTLSVNGTPGAGGWYLTPLEVSAAASDTGSGLSALEYALDSGAWTAYTTPLTIPEGVHSYQFRATDLAGNLTETPVQNANVDSQPPVISLPESWGLGRTANYSVTDAGSGLANVRVVITDPQERYPKVHWDEAPAGGTFESAIAWDGRWADDSLALPGEYLAWVKASDQAGNESIAAGKIDVQGRAAAGGQSPAIGAQPTAFSVPLSLPGLQPTAVPSAPLQFGGQASIPATTLRAGPAAGAGQAAQSPNPQTTAFQSPASQSANAPSANSPSTILWGATASAAAGAFAAETLRRKREYEKRLADYHSRPKIEAEGKGGRLTGKQIARAYQAAKNNFKAKLQQAQALGMSKSEADRLLKQVNTTGKIGASLGAAEEYVKQKANEKHVQDNSNAVATQKGPNWIGIIIGGVLMVVGAAMTFIGLGFGAELEPGGFFMAGAGVLLAAIGAEIVTQSLGSLRPSWWPEHILNIPTRK